MMKTMMIRYKVKPALAAENQRLIEKVFAELERSKPQGLRYQSFRLDDGVSFVHVATREGGPDDSPLLKLESFKAFVADIRNRCDEPPAQMDVKSLGRYDVL